MKSAPLGAVVALLLFQSGAYAQDGLDLDAPDAPRSGAEPEAEMRVRVASEFPDALLIRFRNVRRITTEAGHEIEFCGQVSALDAGQLKPTYQVFLYHRTGTAEHVRVLGTEALNGFHIGRKLMGALRRAGCM